MGFRIQEQYCEVKLAQWHWEEKATNKKTRPVEDEVFLCSQLQGGVTKSLAHLTTILMSQYYRREIRELSGAKGKLESLLALKKNGDIGIHTASAKSGGKSRF